MSQQSLSFSQWLKTTIKASDAKQQQIYSRLWCSEGFVNKTDDYSDDRPLDEVSRSLHQSEFQPDVQVHVVVQHKCANHENAKENAEARTFRSARSALMRAKRTPATWGWYVTTRGCTFLPLLGTEFPGRLCASRWRTWMLSMRNSSRRESELTPDRWTRLGAPEK